MRWRLITLLIFLALAGQSALFAQRQASVATLDSLMFASLEQSRPDVNERANAVLKACKDKPASKYIVNAYTVLGIINKDKGYYTTSLNNYLKALNTAEALKDTGRMSACYNNIGSVYQLQENYSRALEYFRKSLQIEEKLKQPLQKSIRYYNIGEVYKEMDSLDVALNYFNNSLLIERNFKNPDGIIYALLGIADIYIRINRLTDAEISLQEIKGMLKEIYVEESILYYQLYGKWLSAKNDSAGALQALGSAEQLSRNNSFRIHLPDIYAAQIELLIAQGKWQAAVIKQQEYIKLRDELNDVRVKNQLEDLSFQNELNKKELEISLIQEERDLAKKNEAAVQDIANYTRKIVLFLIVSLVGVLGLIFYGIKKITRNNAP
jgi:tetratricopeptide (TPR) repeat protein